MELVNSIENVKKLAEAYNKSIPRSQDRHDGDLLLTQLTNNPAYMFHVELCKNAIKLCVDDMKSFPMKTADDAVINLANLRGQITAFETMISLVKNAEVNVKKFSDRESKMKESENAIAR